MTRGEPEVVTEIMDSISRLKDSKGSSVYKILDDISAHRPTQRRNASLQIKKALKSAVQSGLVKENGGRFKLGLGPKDYATLNLFKRKGTSLPIKQLRGRRRRRSRSRKRRGRRRRRSHYEGIEFLEKSFDKNDILGLIPTKNLKPKSLWNLPIKQLRRRRAKRGRSRRRKGRRRRRGGFDDFESVGKDSDEGFSEPMDRGRRRKSRRRGRRRRGRRRDAGSDEEIDSATLDLKNTSTKASKDKPADNPKQEPSNVKSEAQKPEPVPPSPEQTKTPEKSHYIHEDYPWDGPYGQHYYPPYSAHYGEHYYHH